jgi:hypothetical protein
MASEVSCVIQHPLFNPVLEIFMSDLKCKSQTEPSSEVYAQPEGTT